jgi:flagella basal body P-ring formation protein FlgA
MISPRNICLVCKGESVTIIAKSNDFMIKTIGKALSDGSKGEEVKVRNSKSGRIINARVESVNKVIINL